MTAQQILQAFTIDKYTSGDPEKARLFAAGFITGQAEKIYLGACRAAMFRPADDRALLVLELAQDAAECYGLVVVHPIGSKSEIWICRRSAEWHFDELRKTEENSAMWHRIRAHLCGIPLKRVDYEFHLRSGHGETDQDYS